MAKKIQVEEKKVKDKKKVASEKKVKDIKTLTKKNDVKVNETKVIEDMKEIKRNEIPTEEVSVKDKTKRNKIIKTVIYSLLIVLVIGAFIYSIIESGENDKYFNTITFDEVTNIMNDDELNIIYWASPTCGYCVQFTPIVKQVSYEEGITFNYLNTANLTNEQYSSMMSYIATFDESYSVNGLGTPSIILVKNGSVVDISVGAQTKQNLINYLTTNGFIK